MSEPAETLVFLFGTLRDAELARIVFGADLPARPACLRGYVTRRAEGGDWPTLIARAGGQAEGLCVWLPPGALARADFYEALYGYRRAAAEIEIDGAVRKADVWFPPDPAAGGVAPWSLADWQAAHGDLARAAAEEIMAAMGARSVDRIAARLPMIRARAQARINARTGAPTDLRRAAGPGDLEIRARRVPYAGFFSVEEVDLRHARFGGGLSAEITRAALISADAVTVLPYDPVRDRVLVIEQFRAGALARGDVEPWTLEAVAGRIDAGETPEEAARREAWEEAGLEIGALLPVAGYYPTPGILSEFLYSFLALADLPEAGARLGGLASEHEDIRAHVIPFARLMALVASGEANTAPLILSAQALARRRGALREAAGQDTGAR